MTSSKGPQKEMTDDCVELALSVEQSIASRHPQSPGFDAPEQISKGHCGMEDVRDLPAFGPA